MEGEMMELPEPQCKLGYPATQLEDILGPEKYRDFLQWMRGQTSGLCQGYYYDYELKQNVDADCGPHGVAFYRRDVNRFIKGLPVID